VADAPEIDGVVFVEPAGGLKVGEFAEVVVTRAGDHDLWAAPVGVAPRA
jgi:ribosomal protein S12 methylthiotransferase